tara:strand:+ start:143 stop:298 length:156 start_codon:yes stop_codon:yes gene_type:complete
MLCSSSLGKTGVFQEDVFVCRKRFRISRNVVIDFALNIDILRTYDLNIGII